MIEQDAPVSNINSISKPLSFWVSPVVEVKDIEARFEIAKIVDVRIRRP